MIQFLKNLFAKPQPPQAISEKQLLKITDELLAQLGPRQELTPMSPPLPKVSRLELPQVPDGVMANDRKLAVDSTASNLYGSSIASALTEGIGFAGFPYLAELTQRPEYRRASEIIAKEMTRKWMRLTYSGDNKDEERLEKIEKKLDELNARKRFQEAAEHDGFFGRGQIYIDTGATDRPDELKTALRLRSEKVAKGSLKDLVVVDPTWTYPNIYNAIDPLKADFYRPHQWFVMGKLVHESRLMFFISRPLPDLLKPAFAFSGLSLSQMMKPYVDNWLRTRQSVSDLIHAFSVMVLSTDLQQLVQDASSAGNLIKRIELFSRCRDNRGVMAIDKETEAFQNVAAPIAGLHDLQAQSQEHLSAVTGIPLVKLLGITPTGLNASSEGELRVFYDWIHSQQVSDMEPNLKRLIDIIQLSEFGDIDENIQISWESLWDSDEAEEAQVRLNDAQAAAAYIDAGVLSPEDERKRLADDEDGIYNQIDADDMPEEEMPEYPQGLMDPDGEKPEAA